MVKMALIDWAAAITVLAEDLSRLVDQGQIARTS